MFQSLFGSRVAVASNVKQMSVQELHEQIENGTPPLMIDVRSAHEYANDGHIADSRLLPLPVLAQRIDELPKDRPIVVVCRSGNRSQAAAEQLEARGFADVANLVGGMFHWRAAGYTYE